MAVVIPSQQGRRDRRRPNLGPAAQRRVLGTHPGTTGDRSTGMTGVNNSPEARTGALGGSERFGAKFRIALTPDGRIVHLYGADSGVPADQRRQVMNASQSAAALKANPAIAQAAQARGGGPVITGQQQQPTTRPATRGMARRRATRGLSINRI